MARKLMVNNTGNQLEGTIVTRKGSTPGQSDGTVNFNLAVGQQEFVDYGDDSDPYMDELDLQAMANGGVIASEQIVIIRGSALDNMFNMNDTIYVALNGSSFNVTSGNTWTV